MLRDAAIAEAQRQANESFQTRWIIATHQHEGGYKCYPNIEGYEVVATTPAEGADVYRTYVPQPTHTSADPRRVRLTVTGHPRHLCIKAYFVSTDLAREFAASFPKWVKMRAHPAQVDGDLLGAVSVQVGLGSNGVNKGVNETGLKRIRRVLDVSNYRFFEPGYRNGSKPEELAATLGLPVEKL